MSRIPITGMPSTVASLIARSSLLASITNITSGMPPMSRMPPSETSSFSRSRVSWSTSFLVKPETSPDSISSSAFRRRIEPRDRLPVGEHPAQPAVVDEMLARHARGFSNRLLRLTLGADEQHLAARTHGRFDEIERAREQRHGLRQVDDVNTVTRAENIRLHARVPAVGLVAEVSAGLDQLLHRDDWCRHR